MTESTWLYIYVTESVTVFMKNLGLHKLQVNRSNN